MYLKIQLFSLLLCLLFCNGINAQSPKLIWADEFNYSGLPDSTKWDFVDGGNWNDEAQYYTIKKVENARVVNGKLIIEAHKKDFKGKAYTSARIHTIGRQSFKYGRIEIRAQVPSGNGAWPAIWMLGANIGEMGWPFGGAIDIFEHIGSNPSIVQAYAHSAAHHRGDNTDIGDKTVVENLADNFHTYAVDWDTEKLDFSVDGRVYFSYKNDKKQDTKTWPYNNPYDLIINLAIGGTRGSKKGIDDALFPMQLLVDYVRVYEN